MTYWRMRLHPNESKEAVWHSAGSLAAGYIGLGFGERIGDLLTVKQKDLPENKRDYWGFAHEMAEGDLVLVIAHHFPFALATVSGQYNFIRAQVPELGLWFRHFRRVCDVRYYADYHKNAHQWERLTMTDTIARLRSPMSKSYRLIDEWSSAA